VQFSCNFESYTLTIFVLHRYDRRKYRDEPDFDDRSMENNRYSSIMQEEMRSAKIGQLPFLSVNETFCLFWVSDRSGNIVEETHALAVFLIAPPPPGGIPFVVPETEELRRRG
jgi:hypothetical protein